MRKYYLAIDIGASSGRHVVGWREDGEIKAKEVYRFPNGVQEQDGHLIWDIDALLSHVKAGIAAAKTEFSSIISLSIDTWGVDYVLLRGEVHVLPVYAYRDSRTEAVIPQVYSILPFSELYRRTGIQFQPFNTIYQLYADKLAGRLEGVTDFLMLPEYLLWRQKPGALLGEYEGIQCVLCATHDTASAVEGIPMEENAPYISSGTWSLLGVKTPKPLTDAASQAANYSNEGGVDYNRYQKNIMGMWLVNRLKDELCPQMPFPEIVKLAEDSGFDETLDANAPEFLSPVSMKAAFDAALDRKPQSVGDYIRCAYRSLAFSYGEALAELEANTGSRYDRLYIVGGGAKNDFLNQLTARVTGKQIIALPIEATALGNLKIQMEADQ